MIVSRGCEKCIEREKRLPKLDVESFKAYFCFHYNDVVHDYDFPCSFFKEKEKVDFT